MNFPLQRSAKQFYPKPVRQCVVGIQTVGLERSGIPHGMSGNQFHVKINIPLYKYERKKKKVSPQ